MAVARAQDATTDESKPMAPELAVVRPGIALIALRWDTAMVDPVDEAVDRLLGETFDLDAARTRREDR
jgi:hypothetical protein